MNAAFDAAVQLAFSVLLNSLWEGMVIALACALLLRFIPQMNATTRASVLTVALVAAIVLPIATTIVTSARAGAVRGAALVTSRQRAVKSTQPVRIAIPRTRTLVSQRPSASWLGFERQRFAFPRWILLSVVAVWAFAALVALVRLTISLLHLERLKHDALPLAIEYRTRMDRWTRAAKGGRGVRLCRSPEITIPIAVGLFDAMILVPENLIEELSPEDVDRIVLHELAHLRRGDDWVNALERIAQALLFFNPGILWIVGRLDLEREVVCDDWVLDQTAEVRQYATCLARVAEITAWPYRAMAAPGAFITRRSMSIRIERLLEAGRDIRIHTSLGPAGFAVATLVALCIVAGYVSPSFAYAGAVAGTMHVSHVVHASPSAAVIKRKTTQAALVASAATMPPAPAPAAVPRATAFTERATRVRIERARHVAVVVPAYAPSEAPTAQVVTEASSGAYIDDLASAGYRNLSMEQIISLKSVGVDGQYIRGLEGAGLAHPPVDDLIKLAALGVTPDYVRQMRTFFAAVSADDLASLKAVGVSGAYIQELRAQGLSGMSVDEVRSLRAVGVDPEYIRDMRARFGNISAGDLETLRSVGVTQEYIDDLSAAGYRNLNPHQLTQLRALGIDGAFVRDAAAHGFHNLSIDQLVRLKVSGIL